jgi:ATP-dependent Clp protease adaptor protein ClpS
MLEVLVFNDDVTPMDFVVNVLERVFGKSRDEAIKIMLEAHHDGQASCGVYAETHARDLASRAKVCAEQAGHPLKFSVANATPSG